MFKFLRKLWAWFDTRSAVQALAADLAALSRLQNQTQILLRDSKLLQDDSDMLTKRLIGIENDYKRQHQHMVNTHERVLHDLGQSKKLIQGQEEQIKALQGSLETANDIIIPGLVVANQLLTERWRTQVAVEAIRTAVINRKPDDGNGY